MFIKICTRCGKKVEYENAEELKKYFYFKNIGYFQNVCIECTKKEHKDKYANGQYNYRIKKESPYEKTMSLGTIGV
jgi:hypothetical protein